MLDLLFAVLAWLPCADDGAVRVTVKPQQVYIERGPSNQLLNFDFLLENLTPERLRLTSIRIKEGPTEAGSIIEQQ